MSDTTIALGYGNLIDSSVLFGGDWTLGLANLQTWALANVAQSTSNNTAATQFDMDHGSAKEARVLVIPAHNATQPATIRVTRGNSVGATDFDSGVLPCWPFVPLDGFYDGAAFPIVVVFGAANSYRFTRVYIDDSTRDAGTKLRISRPFLGPVFVPWINPVEVADDWMSSFSTVERTETGADWVHDRAPLRHQALVYHALTEAEGWTLKEIMRIHNSAKEVVYIPSLTDRERQQRDGFVGLMRQLSKFEYEFWDHGGMAIGIDQRGGAPVVPRPANAVELAQQLARSDFDVCPAQQRRPWLPANSDGRMPLALRDISVLLARRAPTAMSPQRGLWQPANTTGQKPLTLP